LKRNIKYIISLFLLCSTLSVYSFPLKRKQKNIVNRFGLGAFYGFYRINTNHAINPSPRAAVLFSYKTEFYLDFRKQTSFMFGLEYFYHGLNFNSYYFEPDSIKLYDKSFSYKYSLTIHEICLPIVFKYSFLSDKEALFSPYFSLGYNFRYLLPANNLVTLNGNTLIKENVKLNFKNPLFINSLNSGLQFNLGFQKNNHETSNSGFFVELMCRANFSPYSFQTNYSANSLFTNNLHIGLNLGLKL